MPSAPREPGPPGGASGSGRPGAGAGSLAAALRRGIERHGALRPGEHVLLACSGGPDSVALLDLLARRGARWRLRLSVASVDHGLRPEAAEEVRLVARLARERGLPLVIRRLTLRPGADLQHRARAARYAALTEMARELGASVVATAHTLDDQAETVLARLLRGCGLEGLAAVPWRRPLAEGVALGRPLLGARRDDVLTYLAWRGLRWAEDPSNRDPRFLRSRIRHELLPRLEALRPGAATHLAALAEEARALAAWRREAAQRLLGEARQGEGLRVEALLEAPAALRAEVLRRWLGERLGAERVERAHVELAEQVLRGAPQARMPGGLRLVRGAGCLQLRPDAPTSA